MYFHYCLGVYSRSACLNVHNFKLLLSLGASGPCSPQVVEQGELVRHSSSLTFWHSKAPLILSPPLLGVSSAGELPRNNIVKAAEMIWGVGCATGKGHADSRPAESTGTRQGGLAISPQPFALRQVWTRITWNELSVQGNPVIGTEYLEKTINTLGHFYSLQFISFCNMPLDALVKIRIVCLWGFNSTCASSDF